MIETVDTSNEKEMVQYLKQREDYTLFLLGNYEAEGFTETESPNSGQYMLVREGNAIKGVFCLCKRGSLLLVSDKLDERDMEAILASCPKAPRGILGDWKICAPFWEYMKAKKIIKQETFFSKEILYSAQLSNQREPNRRFSRFLTLEDYTFWNPMRKAYMMEMNLPLDLTEEQGYALYRWRVEKKFMWGLFLDEELVAMADLNAKAFDLCQLGGVYTAPLFRRKGWSKQLVKEIMYDCKKVHQLRKMVIFTDESNIPARKVYESLNVKPVGYFALLFGR